VVRAVNDQGESGKPNTSGWGITPNTVLSLVMGLCQRMPSSDGPACALPDQQVTSLATSQAVHTVTRAVCHPEPRDITHVQALAALIPSVAARLTLVPLSSAAEHLALSLAMCVKQHALSPFLLCQTEEAAPLVRWDALVTALGAVGVEPSVRTQVLESLYRLYRNHPECRPSKAEVVLRGVSGMVGMSADVDTLKAAGRVFSLSPHWKVTDSTLKTVYAPVLSKAQEEPLVYTDYMRDLIYQLDNNVNYGMLVTAGAAGLVYSVLSNLTVDTAQEQYGTVVEALRVLVMLFTGLAQGTLASVVGKHDWLRCLVDKVFAYYPDAYVSQACTALLLCMGEGRGSADKKGVQKRGVQSSIQTESDIGHILRPSEADDVEEEEEEQEQDGYESDETEEEYDDDYSFECPLGPTLEVSQVVLALSKGTARTSETLREYVSNVWQSQVIEFILNDGYEETEDYHTETHVCTGTDPSGEPLRMLRMTMYRIWVDIACNVFTLDSLEESLAFAILETAQTMFQDKALVKTIRAEHLRSVFRMLQGLNKSITESLADNDHLLKNYVELCVSSSENSVKEVCADVAIWVIQFIQDPSLDLRIVMSILDKEVAREKSRLSQAKGGVGNKAHLRRIQQGLLLHMQRLVQGDVESEDEEEEEEEEEQSELLNKMRYSAYCKPIKFRFTFSRPPLPSCQAASADAVFDQISANGFSMALHEQVVAMLYQKPIEGCILVRRLSDSLDSAGIALLADTSPNRPSVYRFVGSYLTHEKPLVRFHAARALCIPKLRTCEAKDIAKVWMCLQNLYTGMVTPIVQLADVTLYPLCMAVNDMLQAYPGAVEELTKKNLHHSLEQASIELAAKDHYQSGEVSMLLSELGVTPSMCISGIALVYSHFARRLKAQDEAKPVCNVFKTCNIMTCEFMMGEEEARKTDPELKEVAVRRAAAIASLPSDVQETLLHRSTGGKMERLSTAQCCMQVATLTNRWAAANRANPLFSAMMVVSPTLGVLKLASKCLQIVHQPNKGTLSGSKADWDKACAVLMVGCAEAFGHTQEQRDNKTYKQMQQQALRFIVWYHKEHGVSGAPPSKLPSLTLPLASSIAGTCARTLTNKAPSVQCLAAMCQLMGAAVQDMHFSGQDVKKMVISRYLDNVNVVLSRIPTATPPAVFLDGLVPSKPADGRLELGSAFSTAHMVYASCSALPRTLPSKSKKMTPKLATDFAESKVHACLAEHIHSLPAAPTSPDWLRMVRLYASHLCSVMVHCDVDVAAHQTLFAKAHPVIKVLASVPGLAKSSATAQAVLDAVTRLGHVRDCAVEMTRGDMQNLVLRMARASGDSAVERKAALALERLCLDTRVAPKLLEERFHEALLSHRAVQVQEIGKRLSTYSSNPSAWINGRHQATAKGVFC
ncbi:hypothetical protein KIPB_008302, partial [Kipferlia bialata]